MSKKFKLQQENLNGDLQPMQTNIEVTQNMEEKQSNQEVKLTPSELANLLPQLDIENAQKLIDELLEAGFVETIARASVAMNALEKSLESQKRMFELKKSTTSGKHIHNIENQIKKTVEQIEKVRIANYGHTNYTPKNEIGFRTQPLPLSPADILETYNTQSRIDSELKEVYRQMDGKDQRNKRIGFCID